MASLEVACFTPESAIIASKCGADRVEFCAGHEVGGTTPPSVIVKAVEAQISIPLFVMIRPRGGDFHYSASEFQEMKNAITILTPFVDGFVFGILDETESVDLERNSELVSMAGQLPCTFHRAFDETKDPMRSLHDLAHCGFTTVLTSGSRFSAVDGADVLALLVAHAKDLGIMVMPGGNVRSSNLAELIETTKARFYHSPAIIGSGNTATVEEVVALKHVCQSYRSLFQD